MDVIFKQLILIVVILASSISSVDGKIDTNNQSKMDTITFGAGCFWCVDAIFSELKGVEEVKSGFSGGTTINPTYKEVITGETGHAEVCQLIYNAEVISFKELLEVFWQTHDPTTLNKQGADVGSQYRSAIFYHKEEQREIAVEYLNKLDDEGAFKNPIVTEITPYTAFYVAGDYHQDYFELNGDQPYCSAVIRPKVEKFKKVFKDKLK